MFFQFFRFELKKLVSGSFLLKHKNAATFCQTDNSFEQKDILSIVSGKDRAESDGKNFL